MPPRETKGIVQDTRTINTDIPKVKQDSKPKAAGQVQPKKQAFELPIETKRPVAKTKRKGEDLPPRK